MTSSSTYFFVEPSQLALHLDQKMVGRKVFLLTDETVHRECLGLLQEFLSSKQELEIMEVEDGSKLKISKNAVSNDATATLNQN